MRSVVRRAALLLLATLTAQPAAAQQDRPPAPGQPDCLVWWQAPEHLGQTVTVCGTPRAAVERSGLLMLQLGPAPGDLRVGLPLALRDRCPETFARLSAAPQLTRLRATGQLVATPEGPLLTVSGCDQLSLEGRLAGAADRGCRLQLGFRVLHDLIPDIVGDCLEDEHHNPLNGDALQRTTGGLLVWRKADNWTAFTDGATTWINGPFGLQSRPNDGRFPWEAALLIGRCLAPSPAARGADPA
jgi:hypothetical protein